MGFEDYSLCVSVPSIPIWGNMAHPRMTRDPRVYSRQKKIRFLKKTVSDVSEKVRFRETFPTIEGQSADFYSCEEAAASV
jgi:hypothetical protein